jgi:hypothetical protein
MFKMTSFGDALAGSTCPRVSEEHLRSTYHNSIPWGLVHQTAAVVECKSHDENHAHEALSSCDKQIRPTHSLPF